MFPYFTEIEGNIIIPFASSNVTIILALREGMRGILYLFKSFFIHTTAPVYDISTNDFK